MILVLIKPMKFMPFIQTSKGWKRGISVIGYIIISLCCTGLSANSDKDLSTQNDEQLSESTESEKALQLARKDSVDIAKGKIFDVSANASVDDILEKINVYKAYTAVDYDTNDEVLLNIRKANALSVRKLWDAKRTSLRNQYSRAIKEKLWEDDIDVRTSNNGHDILFIGAIFAAHKNIKEFEQKIEGTLTILGYRRVSYKWVDNDYAEETYYDLK